MACKSTINENLVTECINDESYTLYDSFVCEDSAEITIPLLPPPPKDKIIASCNIVKEMMPFTDADGALLVDGFNGIAIGIMPTVATESALDETPYNDLNVLNAGDQQVTNCSIVQKPLLDKHGNILVDPFGNPLYGDSITETSTSIVENEDTCECKVYMDTTEEETFDSCTVQPIEAFMSTNLNSKITSYEDLATRILNFLGYPAVGVTDIHSDQIFEAISIACEMYTMYAGYELQYIVFDSNLYKPGEGIRIDQLYTISSIEAQHENKATSKTELRGPNQTLRENRDIYVTKTSICVNDYYLSDKDFETLVDNCSEADKETVCLLKDISKKYPDGIEEFSVIPEWLYNFLITRRNYNKDQFKKSKDKVFTQGGTAEEIYVEDDTFGRQRKDLHFQKMYDYDIMDYRKVVSVRDYVEGSSTTMSSLFSLDAALAQQSFYSYSFSLRGFDLTTYASMRMWTKEYSRILATQRDWSFNNRTQYLKLMPEPKHNQWFFGLLEAYVEKPLRDIIKSPWVFKYALACVKEMLGRIRSKYGDGINLVGGGTIAGNVLLQEGINEKKELETLLQEKQGYGEASKPIFFIG